MKTLIINGSPKAQKGNTEVFVKRFANQIKDPYEICYAVKEDSEYIVEYIKQFDTIIFAMPLYVHAMPGIVMKILERMEPVVDTKKSMGFIVQSGFMESAQSKYLVRYLTRLTERLNYTYLGTVIKGGSAGTYMMPDKMNEKLFNQLRILGDHYQSYGNFNEGVMKNLGNPIELTKSKSRMYQFLSKLGIGDSMFWKMMLKHNNAFDKRFDKPFEKKYRDNGAT